MMGLYHQWSNEEQAMSVEALLAGIRECPEDDIRRLVLADWLEDHDQPERAEFVRLQVRRARAEAPFGECFSQIGPLVTEREGALLAANRHEWLGELPGLVTERAIPIENGSVHYEFSRGLLRLRMEAAAFLGRLPAGLERCFTDGWVEWLELEQVEEHLADVLASPLLAWITDLSLSTAENLPVERGWEVVRLLTESPALAGLRALNLYISSLRDSGARALAACPHLAGLTSLELFLQGVSADGLAALAGSPHLASLTRLYLMGGSLRLGECRVLADNLRAGLLHLGLLENLADDRGAEALASCPQLRQLRSLDLRGAQLSARGAEALAASPHLGELLYLSLGEVSYRDWQGVNPEGNEALRALTTGPGLPRLEHLDLSGCGVTSGGLWRWALAGSAGSAVLRGLDLGRNAIGESGAGALAESPRLTGLTHLFLRGCCLGMTATERLAAGPHIRSLTHLDLRNNPIGDPGAQYLAASPHLGRLEVLALAKEPVGEAGMRALADSPHLGSLAFLCCCETGGGSEGPADRAFWRKHLAEKNS
jgi:uncharacterized protein (TIGR02996 family)